MALCSYCGAEEMMPFRCKFCGALHCGDHRLPENHDCQGLVEYREKRKMSPEKWVYEPFREDRKRAQVGRVRHRGMLDSARRYITSMARESPIYLVVLVIIFYLLVDLIWNIARG